MMETMRVVLEGVWQHLRFQMTTYLPPLLAAAIILVSAYLVALLVRWLIYHIFKGTAIDRFLRRTGLAFMIDSSGRLRATRLAAETAYWGILVIGFLTGLSVFNTNLTNQMTEQFVLMLPRLVVAGIILLGGMWLSQYLGRSALVWAVNEGLPRPRRLAGAVRLVIMFVAVVAASDHLNFARNVFLAAFLILLGGAVLALSLALGLGARDTVGRYLNSKPSAEPERSEERSLWNHL
jgi:hypothetical protein